MREMEDEIGENKLERDDEMRKLISFKSDEIDLFLSFKGKTRNSLKIYKIYLFYYFFSPYIIQILRRKFLSYESFKQ